MIIKTKRLTLRPIRANDETDLIKNINNIKVAENLLTVPFPYDKKAAKFWIKLSTKKAKEKPREDYNFIIALNGKLIGGCGLHHIDPLQNVAELGYWLGENYWGLGYGSESAKAIVDLGFKKLKLRKIEAKVYRGNNASAHLLKKLGFKQEGLLRKSVVCLATKKVRDDMCFGLLREEYKR